MSKICLCLTGKTLAEDLEILRAYRPWCDMAELRVDFLESGERPSVFSFPSKAEVPVILAVRKKIDGGQWTESEEDRVKLFLKILNENGTGRGFDFIDLEEDFQSPQFEREVKTRGIRIIRSFHDFTGVDTDLAGHIQRLGRSKEEILKAAVFSASFSDIARVFRAAAVLRDREKILLCMGPAGVCTRILAAQTGSFLTFSTPKNENLAAPGQLDPRELAENFHFRNITADTLIYGAAGDAPDKHAGFFNNAFKQNGMNAVCVPFPADAGCPAEGFLELADEIGLKGAWLTGTYRETIMPLLAEKAKMKESCSVIVKQNGKWFGDNVDIQDCPDFFMKMISLEKNE